MNVHGLLIEESDDEARVIVDGAQDLGNGDVVFDRVASVEEAKHVLNGHDVIVTGCDRAQALDQIRSFSRGVPIVVRSDIRDLDTVARLIHQGISECVLKTDGRSLIIAIASAIAKRERLADVQQCCREVERLLSSCGAE
jgi:DNA-binding NarL/FixJ family response regulator